MLAALTIVSLVATIAVRPQSLNNYFNYPFTFVVPVGVVASLAGVWLLNRKDAAGEGVPLLRACTCSSCWPGRAGDFIPRCCRPPPARIDDITLSRAHLRPAHAGGWAGLVDLRNGAGRWLRGVCLQQVPRQGGSAARQALRFAGRLPQAGTPTERPGRFRSQLIRRTLISSGSNSPPLAARSFIRNRSSCSERILEHFCIWCRPVLKGHGFSRAAKHQ